MTTATIAGTAVEVNDEGFFVDPTQWTRDIAVEMAAADGIDPLTDRHWQVIDFMRKEYFDKGTGPTVRVLGKTSGVSREGALPAVPQGPGEDGGQDRRHPQAERMHLNMNDMTDKITKVSIIVSKGSLEGIYPALIMANGARAEGMEANLFFTFFGLDAIHQEAHRPHQGRHRRQPRHAHPHPDRRPARHVSGIATHMMAKKMDELDIPPIHEFIEMIGDTGSGLYACKASVDMFGFEKNDFVPQVQDIITVGDFYDIAAGGQIIFT